MQVLVAVVVASLTVGCTGSGGEPPAVARSSAQPAPAAADSPPRGSREPTPYAVPTTPATGRLLTVRPVPAFSAVTGETTVPWSLIRLYDQGRTLAIRYSAGCHVAGRVEVVETPAVVAVRVRRPPTGPAPRPGCASTLRRAVVLAAPLGSRTLLHAE